MPPTGCRGPAAAGSPAPSAPTARAHRKPKLSSRESASEPRPSALRSLRVCALPWQPLRASGSRRGPDGRGSVSQVPARPGPGGGTREAPPTLLTASERFVPTALEAAQPQPPLPDPRSGYGRRPGPPRFSLVSRLGPRLPPRPGQRARRAPRGRGSRPNLDPQHLCPLPSRVQGWSQQPERKEGRVWKRGRPPPSDP